MCGIPRALKLLCTLLMRPNKAETAVQGSSFAKAWSFLTHTHTLDKGPETGGFSRVLGVVGIISIFMY